MVATPTVLLIGLTVLHCCSKTPGQKLRLLDNLVFKQSIKTKHLLLLSMVRMKPRKPRVLRIKSRLRFIIIGNAERLARVKRQGIKEQAGTLRIRTG